MTSRLRSGNDPDWTRLKDTIIQLYKSNDLKDVMNLMEVDHMFKATEKVYKTKLKSWGVDTKYIKPDEYKAILKKKRKREHDAPDKATEFSINGCVVPESKIERWESRMLKQRKIGKSDTFSEIGTPPSLTFRTPILPVATTPSPTIHDRDILSPFMQCNTNAYNVTWPSPAATTRWNEMVNGLSLFHGSWDEFRALNSPLRWNWRMLTPILETYNSPLSGHTQLALNSGPFENISAYRKIIPSSPTLADSVNLSFPAFSQSNETVSGTSSSIGSPFESFSQSYRSRTDPIDVCTRLQRLLGQNGSKLEYHTLTSLLEDLIVILGYAKESEARQLQRQCERCIARNGGNLLEELDRLTGFLLNRPPVVISDKYGPTDKQKDIPRGYILDQVKKTKTIQTEAGSLIVTTALQRLMRVYGFLDDISGAPSSSKDEFYAKTLFRPKNLPIIVALSLRHTQVPFGYQGGILHTAISQILPNDSAVFQTVANGTVQDVVSLLESGRASILDRNEEGDSLLHIAIGGKNPATCKFLIENGLDVDEFFNHSSLSSVNPLYRALMVNNYELVDILMDAGADPTITPLNSINSTALHSLTSCMNEKDMNILQRWYSDFHYLGLSTITDWRGRSPLLMVCGPYSYYEDEFESRRKVRKVEFLLDRGSTVHEIDSDGMTCLHVIFIDLISCLQGDQWKQTLIYLLNKGANPYAEDHQGRSVFDIAYTRSCWDISFGLGGFRADLLDVVLVSCGFDLQKCRQNYPYARRYGKRYDRTAFENIWKGMEHDCPYWDDNMWVSNISDERFVCTCPSGKRCPNGFESHTPEDSDGEDSDGEDSGGEDFFTEWRGHLDSDSESEVD